MTEKRIGNYLVEFNFDKVEISFTYTKRMIFEIAFYGIIGILILGIPLIFQKTFISYLQLGSIIIAIGGISILSISIKRLLTPGRELIVINKNTQTLMFKKSIIRKVVVPFDQISSFKLQDIYTKEKSNSGDSGTIFNKFYSNLIVSTKNDLNMKIHSFETETIVETDIDKKEKMTVIHISSEIGHIVADTCNIELKKVPSKTINKN